jgi:hypothetical protein
MLPKMKELVPESQWRSNMKSIPREFRVPAGMAVIFAFLSIISTAATAVMPLVILS